MEMGVPLSSFAVMALVALLFVVIMALANPRTRPFVIGLGVLLGIGVVFLFFACRVREFSPRTADAAPSRLLSSSPPVRIDVPTAPLPAKSLPPRVNGRR